MTTSTIRAIAFYLPQFHPIPENDAWWGKGFTEWTNVTKATPLFRGHQQPNLPSDLGFYDLRLSETREAQAELAKKHGLGGFCYWHYWFHGRRLLERPFQEVLASGQPDFPFCLAWANESWSRSWLGDDGHLLIEQTYSDADDAAHAQWLAAAFADPRYIRIGNRPMFLIYRPHRLPDARRTTDNLRKEIVRLGLPEPYLVGVNAHSRETDMRSIGFDMTEHHEPQLGVLPGCFSTPPIDVRMQMMWREFRGEPRRTYDFAVARELMDRIRPEHPHFPAYFVGWDNTARRGKSAIIIRNTDPKAVGAGLRKLLVEVKRKPADERIVFLNAWNEWAEGMQLEPSMHEGSARLEQIQSALASVTEA